MNFSAYRFNARQAGSCTACAIALALTACASVPAPKEQLAVSRSAIERANSTAATDSPVELAAGRDKLARAELAMADKNYVLAKQLAEQAEADAVLAEALARSTRSERALAEVRESVRALREELNRR
jgi:Domain of unknown function (DUF4398)